MKIGVISLGLIGGSIFKTLCKTSHEIYAVTTSDETMSKALKYSSHVSKDLSDLKCCDMVFVASPINKTLEVLDSLEDIVSEKCIVLDCASVKEFVMKKKRPYKFIGSHPMAGTQFSGFDASFKELFEGAKWVLTPSEIISDEDIQVVEKIIRAMGASVVIADAKEHDYAVALISHMPLLISQALFNTAKDNELALKLASSGFRDMTRLATSNLEMAKDMREYNEKNMTKALDELVSSVNLLKNTENTKIYSEIKETRSKMYSADGKNIFS